MTNRELIAKLINYDLDAEVVFELSFEDGEPELIDVNDVMTTLPDPKYPDEIPLIILTEELPAIDHQLNLN